MNKLDHLVPTIKKNLGQFDKPGVMFVRPGFKVRNGWPTQDQAIVAVTEPGADTSTLPSSVAGTPVERIRLELYPDATQLLEGMTKH